MNYNTKYVVRLTGEEREELAAVVGRGKVAAGKRRRAQVLLKADAGVTGSGRTDQEICEALDVSVGLVHDVRQAYVEQGLNVAWNGSLRAGIALESWTANRRPA